MKKKKPLFLPDSILFRLRKKLVRDKENGKTKGNL